MKIIIILLVASSVQSIDFVTVPGASQFHAQDALGQYSYGYSGGPSAKVESKSLDGITRGGYSYIDANGQLQSVNYIADPVHGFRVAATNLPEAPKEPIANAALPVVKLDAPEIQQVKLQPLVSPFPLHYTYPFQYHPYHLSLNPLVAYGAPVPSFNINEPNLLTKLNSAEEKPKSRAKRDLFVLPILPSSSQYEIKDNLGQYGYGYQTAESAKTETRSLDGSTNGAYSYVDANGFLQSVHYTADENGFRVAGTNIP